MWSQKKVNIISSWWKVSEQGRNATYQERRVPLHHYDETKAYADRFQQLWAATHFRHKHHHWESNLLVGWFEFSITNAYILHQLLHKNHLSHRDFLISVGTAFLANPIQ
jgi:hypothetical protein